MKTFRKLLALGVDNGNPFPLEHEWLYQLINSYEDIDKNLVYSLFTSNTDYYSVRQEFMITILKETEQYYDIKKFSDIHSSITDIIALWQRDSKQEDENAWSAAQSAAQSAAYSAAESAAWSAYSAAESAAWSAESAARSAAAWSAESAAQSAAESAAYSVAKQKQVELIITLIKKYSI